jgi:hypothetical protein
MIRRWALSDAIDVLGGPAVALLVALEAEGFELSAAGDRLRVKPISKLTADHRASLEAHRRDLLMLLRVCDAGVQERRSVFAQQLELKVPTGMLAFVPGVPYVQGRCFSCGVSTGRTVHGVCWRCAVARRLAVRAPIPADLAAVYDELEVLA